MIDENSILLRITGMESRIRLEELAAHHGWPLIVGASPVQKGFALEFENDKLQLRDLSEPKRKPVSVDFLSSPLQYRRKHGLSKTQVFAKAIGVGAKRGRTVIDATAGMGVDAFFLACLDCKVTAIERSPVVFELLMDGYRRATHHKELEWLPDYLRFVPGEASEFLSHIKEIDYPDVVYMDPMFPEREGKSALPKKEMQVFRKLIGADLDSEKIFALARKVARDRVVVKRPNDAELFIEAPTHIFEGKSMRYEMFKTR